MVLSGAALAQSSLGIGSAEPSIEAGGVLGGFFAWVNAQQQAFYRALTEALKAMRENPWHLGGLVGLSFAYGVFHAAGPGHGKAVISAYMVANEVALRRGILLSFASALLQGFVAIVVVGVTYLALRGTSISMTDATRSLEVASFGLITAFGAFLLWRKLAPMMTSRGPVLAAAGGHGHQGHHHQQQHHHHNHHHGPHEQGGHGHAHARDEVCATCGHSHAPDPKVLSGQSISMGDAWSAVAAVGLRPCSGALIVLTFALLNGLYLGGVLSVFAMSIGTAITVSILASLAVGAKSTAIRYSSASGAVRLTNAIEIFGAACVFLIGLVLLTAALAV
nr:nickel/cobalt transporter [Pararhizobium haloflavum]